MSAEKSTPKYTSQISEGQKWLNKHWPNARCADVNWTMERYDYPPFVRKFIKDNWIKVSDSNGGTYCEVDYYNSLPSNHTYKQNQPDGAKFFQDFKNVFPGCYDQMDKNNKNALNIGASQGAKAAAQHMFKHPETGRQLSYAEMRSFYG